MGGFLQISKESGAGFVAGFVVGGAQDGRRVHGGENGPESGTVEDFAAVLGDAEFGAEEGLGGGGSKADDEFGFDGVHLGVEPGAAGGLFAGAGLLVNAALAARLPLKVFHRVGDVDEVAIDTGFDEAAVEERASGSDEGVAFDVLAIAGGFADEHEARVRVALAEDGLRRVLVERASAAGAGGLAQRFEGMALGQEIGGRCLRSCGRAGHVF